MSRVFTSRVGSARCADRTTQRGVPTTWSIVICCVALAAGNAWAQTAVKVPKPQEKDKAERAIKKQQEKKAQHTSVIEFRGQTAFSEKDLRSELKEQITTIDDFGLTAARGDDAAFFLELF